ncbi:alpha/beta fold hydrolase [Microbacterium excoecariae]|uniref:alpha/beta fold hydrolase n=1 Tax=Microbacterium excoecariae TaxID=2715210 RepID=UPI00140B0B56|nr:alpha/beta hydrolase [Microbacterium excoecariae]
MTSLTRARRALSLVAAASATVVLLAGCANPLPDLVPGAGEETTAPATDGVPADLLPFYEQSLAWEACEDPQTSVEVECATVTAPRDWADPGAGEIELRIARPADRPANPAGSLLINPGGPGSSGIDLLYSSLEYDGIGEDLLATYDVVGFDPRGVSRSTPVSCLDDAEMDAYLYDIPAGERGSEEWEAALDEKAEAFADACAENSGEVLEFVTTEQAARDMDLLRAVLGDAQLNYLGYSYGTFLGATYAELFPQNVGRLVLDGAIDPSVSGSEVGRTQVIAFEESFRTYLASCLEGASCPFRGSVDQAMDDVAALLASVDRAPLVAADGRELGGDALMTAVVAALYSEQNWPYLTEALAGALQGDATMAMFLADFYNGREEGAYPTNSTEAFTAYNCMDYPTESEDTSAEDERILSEQAPVTWQYMLGADVCAFWPYEPTGERGEIHAAGAAPILVVGTTGDPATPYEWAVSLADQLESGTLLTYEGEGHTAYKAGSDCVDAAVEAYLIDGEVPADGATC